MSNIILMICLQKLIYQLNMHLPEYQNLYAAAGFVLTLSVTQAICERVFSKLKIVKNRLRSSTNQDHLEAFMLISVENIY